MWCVPGCRGHVFTDADCEQFQEDDAFAAALDMLPDDHVARLRYIEDLTVRPYGPVKA